MKQWTVAVAGVWMLAAWATTATMQAQSGASQPLSDAIRSQWSGAKKNIKDSAMDVPEAIYGFKPVESVRTFGQIIAHTAGANYVFCSAAKGEKTPFAESAFDALTAKAAIVKVYDDSVAYCDAAFSALTDASAAELVAGAFGGGKTARAAALIGVIGHLNEHYGNLVTYMRIKGIVPPTSRR
jgi:uncharacterized damage-inducible protein DinB